MRDIIIKNKLICVDYILLALAFFASVFNFYNIALAILIIESIFLIKNVKDMVENYFCFTFLFTAFHILYGLSGVISKTWFNQISSTFGTKFMPSPYIMAYSLCTIGLLTGMIIAYNRYKNQDIELKCNNNLKIKKFFLYVSYGCSVLTSLCEFINFIRVGGFKTLLAGKAIYQAAIDELIGTLPAQYLLQIAVAAFGVFMFLTITKKEKIEVKTIIIFLLLCSPYLLELLILGRRGPILIVLFIITVSIFQAKPLKKISTKLFLGVIITYLILSFVYSIRNDIGLLFTNISEFKEKFSITKILKNINPAQNEFGCTYGNFNKLYISQNYELLYGKSYIQGLVHVIPRYLYPGEKPKSITYTFRDMCFPQKSEISSIASTGFSSIMETYWNFGYLGFILYIAYGYILILLEKKVKYKNCFCLLGYLANMGIVYSFHRSDFGFIISGIIITTMEVLAIKLVYIIVNKNNYNLMKERK